MTVPPKLNPDQQNLALRLRAAGPSKEQVAELFGVSPATISNYASANSMPTPQSSGEKLQNAWDALHSDEPELEFLVREHVFRPLAEQVHDETNVEPYIVNGVGSDPYAKLVFEISGARQNGSRTPEWYAFKIAEDALFAAKEYSKTPSKLLEHAKDHVYENVARGWYLPSEQGRDALDQLLGKLKTTEQLIIRKQYGLEDQQEPMSISEVGHSLGLPKDTLEQKNHTGHQKLKYGLRRGDFDLHDKLSPIVPMLRSNLVFVPHSTIYKT